MVERVNCLMLEQVLTVGVIIDKRLWSRILGEDRRSAATEATAVSTTNRTRIVVANAVSGGMSKDVSRHG
jgi:hypothetical protein